MTAAYERMPSKDLEPARNAEWIIVRKYSISPRELPVRRFIVENIDDAKYNPITIDYPDIPYENREGPAEHHFRTVQNESRVVIFKKAK